MKSQVQKPAEGLQHEGKMSMQERIAQSQAYGEKFRANQSGADQREAVKPFHPNKSETKIHEQRMEDSNAQDDE